MRHLIASSMLSATIACIGCDSKPLSGPPELRLGRDQCRECGMIISEDRCSSALIVERDGHREYVKYDDIGCMLDFEREALDGAKVIERHAHDHDSRSWTNADQATFLVTDSDKVPTPMSSGLIAFAERRSAEAALAQYGGRIADYATLATLREEWIARRRGLVVPTSNRSP